MIKPSIHRHFLQEYELKRDDFSPDLVDSINDYIVLENLLQVEIEKNPPPKPLIETEKENEFVRGHLDKPHFNELFGNRSLRQMLTRGSQVFFAKNINRTFGLPQYVLWSDDKNYFSVPKSVYEVINLPLLSDYQGDWQEKKRGDRQELNRQLGELEKVDEQIASRMIEEVLNFVEKKQPVKKASCQESALLSRPLAKEIYQNFVRLFSGISFAQSKTFVYHQIDGKEKAEKASYQFDVFELAEKWVELEMVKPDEQRGLMMTFIHNGIDAIYPISYYPIMKDKEGKSYSIFKSYSTCEFNSEKEQQNVIDMAKNMLTFNTNGELTLLNLEDEIQKLQIELNEA